MSDQWAQLRSIPLPTVFQWLGIDLTHFKTRKGGMEWYGKCFFHEAKNNSTSLSFTNELANCFSCQVKFRGAIDAVKLYRKCGFQEATAWLQQRLGSAPIQTPPKEKTPVLDAPSGELKPLLKDSWRKFAVQCDWLEQRVPDKSVRDAYGIYCYNNPARKSAYSGRVMVPVKDIQGNLFGYLGRAVASSDDHNKDIPKYLFPPGFPKARFLFGCNELRQHLAGLGTGKSVYQHVFLVESPFCVLKFASLGLPAVSPFGWSVSEEQLHILESVTKGIVYLPDKNKYPDCGEQAQRLASRIWLRFPPLPDGVDDPESLSREQILALSSSGSA